MKPSSLMILGCTLALAAPLTAAEPSRPNVLLCIADDWSHGHAGSYGCKWVKTPGFDQVARQGLLFTRAYTPNAKCAPSRSCLLTGRNSWQLEDACNHICYFPPKFTSYMEALGNSGYTVGFTGKGWGPGIARTADNKPRQLTGHPFNTRRLKSPTSGITRNDYAGNFSDFLDSTREKGPWCFWYGALEPHRGYEFGSGRKRAGKALSDIDRVPGFLPDNEVVRNDMLDYAVEVEHFDTHLSRMLAELEKRRLLDNTLVIVTSDHGMPFPRCKGQAYDYSNHVPLAIMWKKGIKKPGRTIDDYVSFIDIAPTVIETAGLSWDRTGMQASPGRSLTELFTTEKEGRVIPQRDHVLIGKERHDIGRPDDVGYPIRGIVKDDKLYIHNYAIDRWPAGNPETGYLNCDGSPTKTVILNARRDHSQPRYWELCFGKRPSEELYDLASDPDCLVNLAGSEAHQKLLTSLKQQMIAELKAQKDPRMFGKGDYFDKIPYATKATRDFYNRFKRGEKVRAGWVNPSDFEKQPIR
jgi:N-sulfoglucosamine sulfohydrolase